MSFRYDPFEEMNRFFEQTRRSMWERPSGRTMPTPASDDWSGMDTNLAVERTDEGYAVMADLPGFETEDLSITFEDGTLTVAAEQETMEESGPVSRRRSRSVHERLRFPATVHEDDITASYRNGVLEIMVPADVGEDEDEHDSHHIDIE